MAENAYARWSDQWRRRGELLGIAALTSALSTAGTGHWIAALVALAVLVLSGYLLVAVELGWRLPGKQRALDRAQRDWMASITEELGHPNAPETHLREIARQLVRLNQLLDERLEPPASPDAR